MRGINQIDDAATTLPILQAAQGIVDNRDGRGIGELADGGTIEVWLGGYLTGHAAEDRSEVVATAFRFGVQAEARYAWRSFVEAESELRSEWSSETGHPPWEVVRADVWAGFDRARNRNQ